MNTLVYHNYFYYYAAAVSGSLCVFFIARLLRSCRWLSFLGYNSMIIMCLHEPVKRAVLGAAVYVTRIPLAALRDEYLWSFACTAVTIVLMVPEPNPEN
jgi:fucose 4-O-acetylase-like acetyltransferase